MVDRTGAGRGLLLLLGQRTRFLSREDEQFLGRDVGEGGRGHGEVLGQHLLGRVVEPVGQQEGAELIEVALVEDQQKLAAVRT
jgi:hypothetical protein